MRTPISLLSLLLILSSPAMAADAALPPGAEEAKERLNNSPRHHEWVDVAVPGSETKLTTFVAYPERKEKAPVVIVIHEIFGLTDWIRAVADQLAADGFIAVAPDLISGKGPGGGGTDSVADRDGVVRLVRGITPDELAVRLDAALEYGTKLPASSGKTATIGFCWGGAASFAYATRQPKLNAAVVYYGTSPSEPEAFARINAAVLGLYGGDDARVNMTIEPAREKMTELNKTYIAHIYDGAGHGFLRAQDQRDGANLRATQQAWPETIRFLREHTK